MEYSKYDLGDQWVEFLYPITIDKNYIYVKLEDVPGIPTYARIKIRLVSTDGKTIYYSAKENGDIPWEYIMREAPKKVVMDYIKNRTNAPPNS